MSFLLAFTYRYNYSFYPCSSAWRVGGWGGGDFYANRKTNAPYGLRAALAGVLLQSVAVEGRGIGTVRNETPMRIGKN